MKILRGCIISFIFCVQMLSAQDTHLSAFSYLDTNTFVIGDKIILHIGVDFKQTDKLINATPEMPLDTATMEIIDKGNWGGFGRGRDWGAHRDIAFMVWDTGLYQIPSINFTVQQPNNYTTTLTTKPIMFTVINPKGVDAMSAPITIKDIVREDSTFSDYWVYILALILFPLLVYFIWKIYFKKKAKVEPLISTPKVYESPQVKAQRLLKELKVKQLCEKGEVKEYYSELSYILRGYYEDALNIPALESTTDELMRDLNQHHKIKTLDYKAYILTKTQRLLHMSDLVKFAKAEPTASEHDTYWIDAFDITEKNV
jgi:hypothetical protein